MNGQDGQDGQDRVRLERIIARQQEELAVARRDAASARAAKSAFLARMSHEIRTPLNTIIGQNHILLRDVSDPRQQSHIDKVLTAAHQLLGLVEDVLDLSQLEAGKVTLARHNFSVENVIAGVAGRVSAHARAKGLALEAQVADDVPRVLRGDAAQLRKLLHNYASNAVKFTEHGSVRITVECAGGSHSAVMLRFAVTDTGLGLTEEQRGHLFQVFEQVDGGVSRRFGGAGLGLALCRELATLMGGRVGADSRPGAGSTFWLEAPFEVGVDAASPPQADAAATARHAGSRRILLVDDDTINNEVAEFLLRLEGFEVDIASDGVEAVELATSGAYAAMLMDIQMPQMDGLEATRRIRRLPEHAATPIIAMTANVFEEDRRACSEVGMSDLVAKPIDPAHLSSVLARWVPAIVGQVDEPPTARPEALSVVTSAPVRAGPTPHEQLLRLQQLIVTDDIEAREYCRTLPPQVCGPVQAELRRRLDDFDYDQAAILVTRRLQQLEQEQAGMNRD